ncbi:uncharacterized protein LOC126739013 [Anthonomus grandis grandis]|uniref:uncharacterized protein LOC126739013 n=1 Tax=Anthonomus grandis grandis TaxID=2921223 RepID=UPI0021651DCB|nr:uncharacterized protein LOC126739013 [Anthonomus grandis grandis]XP_050300497.1 uncharacterized protein LOC126739013 [Anthonomus grandis grandis]
MNWVQNSFMKPHRSATDFFMGSSTLGFIEPPKNATTMETNQMSAINEKKIGEVWSKHNFDKTSVKEEAAILGSVKTWGASSGEDDTSDKVDVVEEEDEEVKNDGEMNCFNESRKLLDAEDDHSRPGTEHLTTEETSPSHHARRPPNAFLIFCKKHRPIVRQRFPTTENRGVTKILGEWWALLLPTEKQPYNDLAKEYKDAFLSANPDFRWYKLPAPPLRTLTTRPIMVPKPAVCTAVSNAPPPTLLSEFTPGKLADESQLGGLTSLMNNNYSGPRKIDEEEEEEEGLCCKMEDNNNEDPELYHRTEQMQEKIKEIFSSPTCLSKPSAVPPKPIKKRIFEQYVDEKNCSKNIFEEKNDDSNLTQQDLLNRVVDGIFAHDKDEPKEQRKADRMCKGKRYERFMVEGKLLGNKRDTKLTQHHRSTGRIDSHISHSELGLGKFNLENTIKRLAERTNVKIDYDEELKPKAERVRTTSETSDPGRACTKSPQTSNFNLDLRIDNLDSLCYDDFVRRKRESKKRKLKIRSEGGHFNKSQQRVTAENHHHNLTLKHEMVHQPVGSKKRKNKSSIMHLNKADEMEQEKIEVEVLTPGGDNALLGLATLAMVAASTEKIGEHIET